MLPSETTAAANDVVQPESIDELRQVVGEAWATGRSLLVRGAGSRLAFANTTPAADLEISTSGLNRVIDYRPEDLTVAVEPGISIAELAAVLAERGQMLPLDAAHPDRATVGGSYASGLGGPRRLGYGSLKDFVLGVEVMTPDATTTKAGGMVVKNVTGYDLARLHYGAHGAFGIVTRLNLKVLPRPPVLRERTYAFDTAAEAHAGGLALLTSRLNPVALYVTWGGGDVWLLHAWFAGLPASVDWQVAEARGQVANVGSIQGETEHDAADGLLTSFLPFVDLLAGRGVARLSVPASRQASLLGRYADTTNTALCADLGSGLVYVVADPDAGWREAMLDVEGGVTFLSLPDFLKQDIDVFGPVDPVTASLLRQLKREYDPLHRLSPGRFVLGL
jgi:glycolate oxidase FAD binding subunit